MRDKIDPFAEIWEKGKPMKTKEEKGYCIKR